MPTAVIMPKFEMAQETGKVATWLKAEGDTVRKGEAILEVETDKVNLEVEAVADGILMGISALPGDVVPIGQTIAYLLKPGETLPEQPAVDSAQPTPAAPAGQLPAQLTTGDATQQRLRPHETSASPLAARLAESLGVDVAAIEGSGPRGQVTREDVEAYVAAQALSTAGNEEVQGTVRAVPAARRVARELGVDLRTVVGTGPEGRIQSDDVRTHFEAAAGAAAVGADLVGADLRVRPAEPASAQPEPPPAPATWPGSPAIRRMVPLTNIRRTIAERMTASVREAPQFTVSLDADMARALAIVEDLRTNATATASGDQPRVTLTTLLIKASAWALWQHPEANSAYQDGQIAEWDEVNIGVATAIETGLIVPVIRQADRLGMREIAARLADLTTRARENRLKIEDLQGGTFTVSNLGMFGIDQFTAILNPPQAAILAVGRVAKRAIVVADDRVEVRPVTTLTLTADHRVLDGVTAARFLATLQRVLEHPGLLME